MEHGTDCQTCEQCSTSRKGGRPAVTLGRGPSQHCTLSTTSQEQVDVYRRVTALTEEANELADHGDFCDSLANWNVLDGEGQEEESPVQALREEARQARRRAQEMVGLLDTFTYVYFALTNTLTHCTEQAYRKYEGARRFLGRLQDSTCVPKRCLFQKPNSKQTEYQ